MNLRVAVDASNLARDRRGMGRHVRGVVYRLFDLGIEPLLVVSSRDAAEELRAERPGIEVATLDDARRRAFDAAWYPWNGMRFQVRAPALVTVHDLFAFDAAHRSPIARWREQRPIARAMRHAAQIATVSAYSAARVAARFGRDATVVPPVLEPMWQPVPAQRLERAVLFVAGPEPRKNARFLIHCMREAFPANDVMLVVAGTLGSEDAHALESSGILHDRIAPNDEALREWYARVAVVAVPSLAEGFGLGALEAMACGAAVIASNATALPEACDGAALLAPPDDALAWSGALRIAIDDERTRTDLQRRSLARAARVDRDAAARVTAELLR